MRIDDYAFRGLRSRLLTTALATAVCSLPAAAATSHQDLTFPSQLRSDSSVQTAMAIGLGSPSIRPDASLTPRLPVADSEPGNDTDLLVERGDKLLELGDPASARLFYELAASQGSLRAATGMGKTFDPAYFAKLGIRGGTADPKQAIEWYEKASDAGDREAAVRLRELSLWLGLPVDVADPPIVEVRSAQAPEDSEVPLSIEAALSDTDGSESLSLAINGVPEGASLSAGRPDAEGVWLLDPADLVDLRLVPPADFSGQFDLVVTATSQEQDGDINVVTKEMQVSLTGVADEPELQVEDAVGEEGVPLSLAISTALVDQDGSEALSLALSGLPEGSTLSAGEPGEDGTWSLGAEDLSDLVLTTPTNFSGRFSLTVDAVATEQDNGESATATQVIEVALAGIADTPQLEVQQAAGTEDQDLSLRIEAALVDKDGSESLSINLMGLPEGASLSAGAAAGTGAWTLEPEDLADLVLTPPPNFSGDFELIVTAEASEADGASVAASQELQVSLSSVPDQPLLTANDATGPEGETLPLDVKAELADTDGSESLSIAVAGLPEGVTLSAGEVAEDGRWELTQEELNGLTLVPGDLYSGSFELTIEATATEADEGVATSNATLAVSVLPVAQAPTLTVNYAGGQEDDATPLSIDAALLDTDGSESLAIEIQGMPAGATLSAGGLNEDGTWLLTQEDLANLTLSPAPNFSGRFVLGVTATAREKDGDSATTTQDLEVWVAGVPDVPDLEVQDIVAELGAPVPLSLAASLHDQDGSETLEITIDGLPEGASLSAGRVENDGTWHLAPEDLSDLILTPSKDAQEPFTLVVNATANEKDGGSATTTDKLEVTFASPPEPQVAATPEAPQAPAEPLAEAKAEPESAGPPEPELAVAGGSAATRDDDTYGIQLSSVRTREAALREASRLRQRHFDLLAGLDFEVEEADVEGQGTFYRVFAGAFFNHTTAEDICGQIEFVEPDQYCLVVRRGFDGRQLASTAVGSDIGNDAGSVDALDAQLVTAVQLQLKDAGYNISQADGKLDSDTSASILAYQAANKLTMDGKPTASLLEHLVAQKHAPGAGRAEDSLAAEVNGGQTSGITIPIGSERAETEAETSVATANGSALEELDELATSDPAAVPGSDAAASEQQDSAGGLQVAARSPGEPEAANQTEVSPEIAMLMERGNELLELGDPASARLFYELAADKGNAAAAAAVGKTYDPLYLQETGVKGPMADPSAAMDWYKTAAEGGDSEAAKRLENLSNWIETNGG